MASELLKNRALIQKLKEPEIENINFDLAGSALDYSVESLEEEILPQPKPQELLDIQEDVRIQRQQDTMDKARPFLMEESVDFIEREEFDRGGVVKVLAHLDSLPEGTDIDLEYVRKYIADNNINADAKGIMDQLEPNKINRKQISSAGNETFTYKKEKRDLLTRLNKKLNIKKLKEFVPATKENLEKLDNLIKNTDLNIEQIGKELGFRNPKSFKFAPTTKNVLVKEYIKKYGSPPEGRFKITKLTPESKIVKEAIRLKELGLSTTQVANELNIDRSAIVNYFRKGGREDLVGQVNPKKEGTPESRKKAARMANIKEGEKFASKADKAFNKAEDLRVKKINSFLKNNSDQLANNQKFINLVNLKLDGKGNIISKNKSPEEIAKLLKKDRLFERDHISSVAKRKRNMQFPVNFQMAPQNINQGFFGAAEAYVNRPDADPEKIKKISNVLDQYGLRLSTNKGTIGAKQIPASQVIDRNLKALGLSTDIGKEIKIPTAKDSKNIAKKLASFGFKCSAAEGGACDNPLNYLDDIKKQQAIAKGSGNAAANAVKKLSAGKTILREFIGPAALTFELAAAVPLGYLSYKAGLPPARIANQLTYGAFGDTETARLKKIAVKEGIDTADIQKALDFEKASGALQTLAMQEGDFRGPDDEMLFPQQFEKGEEDFYKAVGAFRDKEGNISKDVFQTISDQLKKVRGIISEEDAALAAEREAKTDLRGIGDYLTEGIIPEEQPILPVFDFQEESTRMDFSEGGPNDPSRRTFLKFLAGIASLPFVGKFFKAAKAPKVVKLANTTTKMPDWFPSFVDKAFEKGIAKKIDADITEVDIPELPNVKVRKYDDGRIEVEGKNGYGETYEIDYTPPGYEVIDETTGKAVKTPGEFQANDTVYRRVGPEGDDFDVDFEVVDDVEQILGGDSTALEGFAKGTGESKYTRGQRNLDAADQLGERADEFSPYGDVDPTDFADE